MLSFLSNKKNTLYIHTIRKIIRRFVNNKPIGDLAKKVADNLHPPKPPVTPHLSSNNIPKPSPAIAKSSSAEKPVPKEQNSQASNLNKQEFISTTNKVPHGLQAGRYGINPFVSQTQQRSEIPKDSSSSYMSETFPSVPPPKKFITPEKIAKKGNTYFSREADEKKSQTNKDTITNEDVGGLLDNMLVGVTLKTNNPPEYRTQEQKHVNFAVINAQDQAEVFAFATSSAGHSKDKADHGMPKNVRFSNTKMDKSFVPVYHIEKNNINPEMGPDFISVISESETKGGQYVAIKKEITIVQKDDYNISELGTDYIYKTSEVEAKLNAEYNKIKFNQNTTKTYNPNEKRNDEEIDK